MIPHNIIILLQHIDNFINKLNIILLHTEKSETIQSILQTFYMLETNFANVSSHISKIIQTAYNSIWEHFTGDHDALIGPLNKFNIFCKVFSLDKYLDDDQILNMLNDMAEKGENWLDVTKEIYGAYVGIMTKLIIQLWANFYINDEDMHLAFSFTPSVRFMINHLRQHLCNFDLTIECSTLIFKKICLLFCLFQPKLRHLNNEALNIIIYPITDDIYSELLKFFIYYMFSANVNANNLGRLIEIRRKLFRSFISLHENHFDLSRIGEIIGVLIYYNQVGIIPFNIQFST